MQGARVPDPRNIHSLIYIEERLANNPGVSFSTAVGHDGRQASHRICGNPDVSMNDLLAGHFQQTELRCQGYSTVLVAQDTTAMNFSTHRATTGLGPINTDQNSLGFLLHPALAMTRAGQPLGLLYATAWVRDPEDFGKADSRRNREYEERESRKWLDGLRGVEAALPDVAQVILLADREGDVFSYLAAPRRPGLELIVRAAQPRNVEIPGQLFAGGQQHGSLFAAGAMASVVGEFHVMLPRRPGKRAREADLEVRVTPVMILPPRHHRATDSKEPQLYWLVRATEGNPPEGEEPVDWVLLTTMEVTTLQEARQVIDDYLKRWMIERLNYILKSGFRVEKLQVDEGHALINTVALYLPVACRTLSLTHLARTAPETPAIEVLSEDELAVLSQQEGKPIENVGEAVVAVAKLGGYRPYRGAPAPGVKSVWLGLRRLEAVVYGWRLAHKARNTSVKCGMPPPWYHTKRGMKLHREG